jgi:hypothetical protein
MDFLIVFFSGVAIGGIIGVEILAALLKKRLMYKDGEWVLRKP